MVLPSFNESGRDTKLSPLESGAAPPRSIDGWLARAVDGRERSSVRVLDVGCGRGDTVAWLVDQGFDGYGLDVRSEYIANGLAYLGLDRLKVLEGTSYPFPDDYFDIVLSDQVFEHVADLRPLASEVARTTKRGGVGLHIFPAKWCLVEPHLLAPVVHWLPKGRLRREAIRLALRTGRAAPYFADFNLDERTEIFSKYSEGETFYRRPVKIREALEEFGLTVDFREVAREQLMNRLDHPALPAPFEELAVWAYRTTRMVYLSTRKR